MSTLQEEIADAFLERVENSPELTPEMIEGLRAAFAAKKKLKADEFVKVLSPPAGGEVK